MILCGCDDDTPDRERELGTRASQIAHLSFFLRIQRLDRSPHRLHVGFSHCFLLLSTLSITPFSYSE